MKVVILAGGLGTRLSEETHAIPKPMVEIGDRPILWHIMQQYAYYGIKDFYIALGYKADVIKRYFLNFHALESEMLSINLADGSIDAHRTAPIDWRINLIETGLATNTGGRLKRLAPFLSDGTFMLTYGDGVSNINLHHLLDFHRSHGKIATVSAVRPPARFGGLTIEDGRVTCFIEKPQIGEGWINGGFMVFEPQIFDYIADDHTILESHVLEKVAEEGQLMAYQHHDFWQCMDTLRDKRYLQSLWESGNPPWIHK